MTTETTTNANTPRTHPWLESIFHITDAATFMAHSLHKKMPAKMPANVDVVLDTDLDGLRSAYAAAQNRK